MADTAGEAAGGTGPRARFRGQIREESKELALRQLAEGGPQALSLNAVAKSLGMSGPALYRYFANREALLTALIVDAYADLAGALREAVAAAARPEDRLTGLVAAYRHWALAQPHRYRLLFRAPLYGYDAQAADLVEASRPAMDAALAAVTPLLDAADPAGRSAAARRAEAAAFHATSLWAGLHGLVSLEIEDNFSSMGFDPAPLYEAQTQAVVRAAAGS